MFNFCGNRRGKLLLEQRLAEQGFVIDSEAMTFFPVNGLSEPNQIRWETIAIKNDREVALFGRTRVRDVLHGIASIREVSPRRFEVTFKVDAREKAWNR